MPHEADVDEDPSTHVSFSPAAVQWPAQQHVAAQYDLAHELAQLVARVFESLRAPHVEFTAHRKQLSDGVGPKLVSHVSDSSEHWPTHGLLAPLGAGAEVEGAGLSAGAVGHGVEGAGVGVEGAGAAAAAA